MMQKKFVSGVEAVIAEVSAARMLSHLTIVAAEDRSPGGPGEARAFDHLERTLRALPVTVTRLEADGFVSVPISARLIVHVDGADTEIACITHSATASTGPDGFEGPLVWAGKGEAEDYADRRAAGAVALVSGRPTVTSLQRAEAGGCTVQVYVDRPPLAHHNLSTFAGNPTDEVLGALSPSVALTIGETDGEQLRALLDRGPVTATVRAEVETGWRPLPLLAVDITPDRGDGTFVMFGAHVDSWYEGAVDNGAGVVALVEIARIVAGRRDELYRGARLLFWSGHEHGLYAGSSWYVDQHWQDLYDHAIAALAIDSPGAAGSWFLTRSKVMDELADVAAAAAQLVTGGDVPAPKRPVSGEQPLWRIGAPSLHPDKLTPDDRSWMHTTADGIELIDPEVLVADTRIHLAALWSLVGAERLPLRYETLAANLAADLEVLGGALDLSGTAELARGLAELAARAGTLPAARANDLLRRVGRTLIPVLYTRSGSFDLDSLPVKDPRYTAPKGFLLGLQEAGRLSSLEPGSLSYHGLRTRLVRQRNRLDFALRQAIAACEQALADP